MAAKRFLPHREYYQVNIVSFSLTLVHYTAALLASQRSSKAEGMSGELLVFIMKEPVHIETRPSKSRTGRNFT